MRLFRCSNFRVLDSLEKLTSSHRQEDRVVIGVDGHSRRSSCSLKRSHLQPQRLNIESAHVLAEKGVDGDGGSDGDGDGHGDTQDGGDGETSNKPEEVTKSQQKLALLSAFLTNLLVLGCIQSFGILQRHFASDAAFRDGILPPAHGDERATIAAIGALGNGGVVSALCAMWFIPMIPLLGRKIKLVCLVGSLLLSLGWAAAAASTKLPHLLGTMGVISGIGAGILFNTVPTVLPEYFEEHCGWAQGVASTGSGIGGLVFCILLNLSLRNLGSRKTFGMFAAIFFALGVTTSLAAQPARKFEKRRTSAVGWNALKNPMFLLFSAYNFLIAMSFRTPMTFGPSFSKALHYSPETASYLLAAVCATGIVTRPLLGWTADKIGHQNSLILNMAFYGLGCFTFWLSAARWHSRALWIMFIVLCGMLNGAYFQLSTSVAQRIFGSELYFSYSGAFMAIRGVGLVIGNPISGALVAKVREDQLVGKDFYGLILFTGISLMGGTLCLLAIRWIDSEEKDWDVKCWIQ